MKISLYQRSSNRKPIPATGSLADRIAKLNLVDPTSGSAPNSPSNRPPSGPPSPTAVRTGAVTKISDKISRFQVNAEENPLLPVGGSFGLAPARPSNLKERGAEKGRVASLGAGRAPVPLHVVKPKRTASGPPSETGSAGSFDLDRRTTSEGSDKAVEVTELDEATSGRRDDAANQLAGTTLPLNVGQLLASEAPRTPGAMSVSSLNVETGSIASESGRTTSESELTPSLATSDIVEPPAFPTIDIEPSFGSQSSMTSSEDDSAAPPTPPAFPVKGPLDALRQPSRTASMASMSSLVVEAPPEDVADLDAISASGHPATSSENGSSSDKLEEAATPTEEGNGQDGDEERLERTNRELSQYEADELDPTAHGPGPDGQDDDEARPVRPTWEVDEETATMPKVKCSDCNVAVDLVELADHSCEPGSASTSTTGATVDEAPVSSVDVSDRRDEQAHSLVDAVQGAPATPAADPSKESSADVTKQSAKLDEFVPQTDSMVPEDIAPDDDVLDMYGDDGADENASVTPETVNTAHTSDADVPVDLDEDDLHATGRVANSSSQMSRSLSQPTTRAPKEASGPRSHSVYLPGHYDEDEDDYQGGTVTIVRSNR
ncbi:uncharacterized protein JCM15063_001449 [Sporobolomyces koalae]|uniref:uncharacterized protein n=1 Tax=Sporobolomyces koalae TaxID=500713 RepID=UPI00317F6C9F